MKKNLILTAAMTIVLFVVSLRVSAQDNGDQLKSAKNLYEQGEFTKIIDLYKDRLNSASFTQDDALIFSAAAIHDFRNRSPKSVDRFFSGHLGNAEKALKKVIDSQPGHPGANYLLGIIGFYKKDYPGSELYLRVAVENDELFSLYGFSPVMDLLTDNLSRQKKYADIKSLLSGKMKKNPMHWVYLSAAERGLGDYDSSALHFYEGIRSLDDAKKLDQLFTDIRDIADKNEISAWKELKDNTGKRLFLIRFWKQRDPDPLDIKNERLDEHYQRLDYAREYYPLFRSPGYDDRGMIYIRFGKPNFKLIDGQTDYMESHSYANIESWFYNDFGGDIEFDFINTAGIYELRPLSDILNTYQPNQILGLMKKRADHNTRLMAIYSHLENQLKGYINRNPKVRPERDPRYQRIFFDFQLKVEDVFRKTTENYKLYTDVYQKRQEIPINAQTNIFLGVNGKSRLDFSYMIPVSSLKFKRMNDNDLTAKSTIRVNFTVLDTAYSAVSVFEKTYQIESAKQDVEHYFVDEIRSELQPGIYIAAIRIVNNDKEQTGVYQIPVHVKSYASSDIHISDIQIASRTAVPPVGEKFIKPGTQTEVVPNPIAEVSRQNPLILYYEIYGLTLDDGGKSHYTVSYEIRNKEVKRNIFQAIGSVFSRSEKSMKQTTTRTGESTRSAESIGFDVSSIVPGNITMDITVRDLNTGRETVVSREMTMR